MENGEKYAKQIVNAVTKSGYGFGIVAATNKFKNCNEMPCKKCLFYSGDGVSCVDKKRAWAISEYIERPEISKKDRAFLEYLDKELKYIARDKNGKLTAYEHVYGKDEDGWLLGPGAFKSFFRFCVQFPMIKWEDNKPWSIDELKNLEICETYEKEPVAQ